MIWAVKRKTKREEDAVYSLFGIFDVHMPLIYSEGKQKALGRLNEEIKKYSNIPPEISAHGKTPIQEH
jgi:hypothetical protein